MPYDPINTGASANDGTGDPLRSAWDKANAMLAELYTAVTALGAETPEATGVLVTLSYQLLIPTVAVAGTKVMELPRFPKNFIMRDVFITATRRTDGTGDVSVNASLLQDLIEIAVANGIPLPGNGVLELAVTAVSNRLTAGAPLRLETTIVDSETGGVSSGLTLWLRGTWED